MRFKKEELSLYNGPDSHIGAKHKKNRSQFKNGEDSDDSEYHRDMRINDFNLRNSGLNKPCKYHLFTSKKGKEEFIKNIES